jgi:LCP family protein required for cell wall assembly
MTQRKPGRVAAGLLSMLVPGAGQLYAGARRRGLVLLGISAALVLGAAVLVAARPWNTAAGLIGRPLLASLLAANLLVLAFRLFALVDAWRVGRGAASTFAVVALGVFAAFTAAPHVAAGYVAVRGYDVLEDVFADDEPTDVLPANGVFLSPAASGGAPARTIDVESIAKRTPGDVLAPLPPTLPLEGSRDVLVGRSPAFERPWITLLLLGSDSGPGQWGDRTDTMIVVALQRGTGRAAAFGIPRNLVEVPLVGYAAGTLRRFHEPLNGLYAFARTRPELFPGTPDAGATALKQTLSRLLGIRIDYYALVDLNGFVDMVDALGGVRIHVKERLVDEVTRPAWGQTKPTIDVYPGHTYHFFGRTALAYVRSRKASDDYTRMARQRCFLSALARQLDVVRVLRNFRSLAATVEASVRTDIPLSRAPDLVRLARRVEPRQTLTATFGRAYILRRRAGDRYPIPNVAKIRATVRDVILLQSRRRDEVTSVREAC